MDELLRRALLATSMASAFILYTFGIFSEGRSFAESHCSARIQECEQRSKVLEAERAHLQAEKEGLSGENKELMRRLSGFQLDFPVTLNFDSALPADLASHLDSLTPTAIFFVPGPGGTSRIAFDSKRMKAIQIVNILRNYGDVHIDGIRYPQRPIAGID